MRPSLFRSPASADMVDIVERGIGLAAALTGRSFPWSFRYMRSRSSKSLPTNRSGQPSPLRSVNNRVRVSPAGPASASGSNFPPPLLRQMRVDAGGGEKTPPPDGAGPPPD